MDQSQFGLSAETPRKSDLLLRQVMDSITAFVGLMDCDGTLIDINRAAMDDLHLAPEAGLGKPFWEASWWSYSNSVAQQVKDMTLRARAGERCRADVRALVEGRLLTMDLSIVPIHDAEGTVTALAPCGIDISERDAAQQAVARSEEQFRRLVAATAAIIWTTAPTGGLEPGQIQWSAFTGQTPDEYRGFGWLEAIHPEDRERTTEAWHEAVRSCNPFEIEHRVRRCDGEYRYMQARAVPILQEQAVREWAGLHLDITELRAAQAQLAEASRAKSQFLASMSHELRTPLNAIIGYSEMLQEEAEDFGSELLRSDLRKINSAGKHLLSLINGVLDLSKIEAGKVEVFIEEFALEPMLREIAGTVEPLIRRNGNALRLDAQAGLGNMRSDVTKIRQCLFNLLSNAAKFTEHGSIYLTARALESGEILFSVIDTGIGIAADRLDRLFQPFAQADSTVSRKYGGTGLGLAITKRFTEMLGGRIEVSSTEGKGTCFELVFPREAPGAAETPAPKMVGQDAEGRPLVLVIDDDPTARELMQRHLRREGFATVDAADGPAGLRLAKTAQPKLITLDVDMPGMDGWSVLQQLKADPELREIPVIMATVIENRNLGYLLGAFEYLVKPIHRDSLLQVLHRLGIRPPGTALVIDDDEGTRRMLRASLERDGWTVLEATDGQHGLEVLAAHKPNIILLDLLMPRLDGFGFTLEVRKMPEYAGIPIVVLTAKDVTAEERQRLNGSVQRILTKSAYNAADLMLLARQAVRWNSNPEAKTEKL